MKPVWVLILSILLLFMVGGGLQEWQKRRATFPVSHYTVADLRSEWLSVLFSPVDGYVDGRYTPTFDYDYKQQHSTLRHGINVDRESHWYTALATQQKYLEGKGYQPTCVNQEFAYYRLKENFYGVPAIGLWFYTSAAKKPLPPELDFLYVNGLPKFQVGLPACIILLHGNPEVFRHHWEQIWKRPPTRHMALDENFYNDYYPIAVLPKNQPDRQGNVTFYFSCNEYVD